MYEQVPAELKNYPNWLCFKFVPDEKHPEKPKKVPVNPLTGYDASSTNPNTWSDFKTAVEASKNFSGIGFVFTNTPYFGVDLDKVEKELHDFIEGDNNIITEFMDALQSYTELSPSGKGIHIICRGKLPPGGRKNKIVEMYDDKRFFTITGNRFGEYKEIRENTETIKPLHQKYLGKAAAKPAANSVNITPGSSLLTAEEILKAAKNAKNADKFIQLFSGDWTGYNSQSEADLALCNILAFWSGRDADMMDLLFRQSGLYREKWDKKDAGITYGLMTIRAAIADCPSVYSPDKAKSDFKVNIGNGNNSKPRLYSLDDMGNAQRFIDLFGEDVRYNYTAKSWTHWDGTRWQNCVDGTEEGLADRAVEAMKAESKVYEQQGDENVLKAFNKHLKSCRSHFSKVNMLKEARHKVPAMASQFDNHPYALNTPDGIISLKSGKTVPHERKYMITKITKIQPHESACCPLWTGFLNKILGGDADLIRYVQKALGYSLTGDMAEQCIFIMFGEGNNGKSTFLETIRNILGDYSVNIQAETIFIKKGFNSSGGIRSDIARLNKARIVTCSEPDKSMRFNEGLIKQLTGGDPVTARKLFENETEFHPELKLWIATNYLPGIQGTDTGIWRRIRVIPLKASIPDSEVDLHFSDKLKEEYPQIFRWILDGCQLWREEGLKPPAAVVEAVRTYRGEMDVISRFIEERCRINDKAYVKASDLYRAYDAWCEQNNEYKMSNTRFGAEIIKRYQKIRKADAVYYIGINLLV